MDNIRIGIGQINSTIGDIKGNCEKIVAYINKAAKEKVDVLAFPELSITGYPPQDLLLKPTFIQECRDVISTIEKAVGEIVIIVGFPDFRNNTRYNSAVILHNRKKIAIYDKIFLPENGILDEKRYFSQGESAFVINISGYLTAVNICEDIHHAEGPIKTQASKGANLIFNISASPYHMNNTEAKTNIIREQCIKNNVCVCYVNLTGGQDEIVFDGESLVMDHKGDILYKAPSFKEGLFIADIPLEKRQETEKADFSIPHNLSKNKPPLAIAKQKELSKEGKIYSALTTGLRDYVLKNSFKKIVLGLSGGMDSSLAAAIAVDALGDKNVIGIFMPSRYTSKESEEDTLKLTENLKIQLHTIPIEHIFNAYLETLSPAFCGQKTDTTEENIQSRIRGNILMALSNKFGYLAITNGNKSEISVGYFTLYGDMTGGFAVIKDIYKTQVYKLAEYRNSINAVIPDRVFTKTPTAELRPNQKDQDILPPYEILDGILKKYFEKDKSFKEILSSGYDRETVKKVLTMVYKNEYKRKQLPPGTKITPKSFRKDRRMPITNRFTLM
ncbi:MAG: NAD+ synthase [Elusimicrobia bacterium]|nr:NAD+ synthase [Elusimicrobiota bacterium]